MSNNRYDDEYYTVSVFESKLFFLFWVVPIMVIIGDAFFTELTKSIHLPKKLEIIFSIRVFWANTFPDLHKFLNGWGLIIYFAARGGLKSDRSRLSMIRYIIEANLLRFFI